MAKSNVLAPSCDNSLKTTYTPEDSLFGVKQQVNVLNRNLKIKKNNSNTSSNNLVINLSGYSYT